MKIWLWPQGSPLMRANDTYPGPSLTAYLADNSPYHAAFIVCPGGGYGGKAEHEGAPVAQWLNRIGIHAFVLDYRTAGEGYHHPCAAMDVQRAIRTVRHRAGEWGINPDKVGVLGFSAGGHLAALSGVYGDKRFTEPQDDVDRQSARPDRLVLAYPVITDGELTHQGSLRNFVGGRPEFEALFALDRQVSEHTPPAFLWHTSDDGAVDVRNSLLFASALRSHGIPFELHVYEKGRHGLGLAPDHEHVRAWTDACASWLKQQQYAN
jgi:Esterase/lipase